MRTLLMWSVLLIGAAVIGLWALLDQPQTRPSPDAQPRWQLHLIRPDVPEFQNLLIAGLTSESVVRSYEPGGAWLTLDETDLAAADAATGTFTLTAEAVNRLYEARAAAYPDIAPSQPIVSLWPSGFVVQFDGQIACVGEVDSVVLLKASPPEVPDLDFQISPATGFMAQFKTLSSVIFSDPPPCPLP